MGKGRKMGTEHFIWDNSSFEYLETKGRKMGKRNSLALYDYYAAFLRQNLSHAVLHKGFRNLSLTAFLEVVVVFRGDEIEFPLIGDLVRVFDGPSGS